MGNVKVPSHVLNSSSHVKNAKLFLSFLFFPEKMRSFSQDLAPCKMSVLGGQKSC